MVEKLSITTLPHPRPYYIQWFNNSGKVKVTRSVRVHFFIAAYDDYVECDVVPMQACTLLLGRPSHFKEILYTMVQQISILLFIMINQLCYFDAPKSAPCEL
jgi:hypothetical protein